MLDIPITTFHVVNLGCKVNRVESDAVSAALVSSGARQSAEETADLIVVNTCTVTGEAEKKARKAVRHAISCNPHARVIVTGCAVAIDEATYAALGENVEIVQRGELLASMTEIAKGTSIRMGDGFRTRVNIKIQDGKATVVNIDLTTFKVVSIVFYSPLDDTQVAASALVNGTTYKFVATFEYLVPEMNDSVILSQESDHFTYEA